MKISIKKLFALAKITNNKIVLKKLREIKCTNMKNTCEFLKAKITSISCIDFHKKEQTIGEKIPFCSTCKEIKELT